MLKPTEETLGQEVPSLVLGPPSPSWTIPSVGSLTGQEKTMQLLSDVHGAHPPYAQKPPATAAKHKKKSVSKPCTASCQKRVLEPTSAAGGREVEPVKRARQSYPAKLEDWPLAVWSENPVLIADTEEVLLDDSAGTAVSISSAQEMAHVDTEEFINEFWGDLLPDLPPMVDGDSLIFEAEQVGLEPLNANLICDVTDSACATDVIDTNLITDVNNDLISDVTTNMLIDDVISGDLMSDVIDGQLLDLSELLESPPPSDQHQSPPPTVDLADVLHQSGVSLSSDDVTPPPAPSPPAESISPAEKYRRIRDNNNQASRRSRQHRKQRERAQEDRVVELTRENARLRAKEQKLENLLKQVKALSPLLTARR